MEFLAYPNLEALPRDFAKSYDFAREGHAFSEEPQAGLAELAGLARLARQQASQPVSQRPTSAASPAN